MIGSNVYPGRHRSPESPGHSRPKHRCSGYKIARFFVITFASLAKPGLLPSSCIAVVLCVLCTVLNDIPVISFLTFSSQEYVSRCCRAGCVIPHGRGRSPCRTLPESSSSFTDPDQTCISMEHQGFGSPSGRGCRQRRERRRADMSAYHDH